jgi:hypothetical protein
MDLEDELIERLCEIQHDAYEAAAAEHGWKTNPASRTSWAEVPEANKQTMRASMRAVLAVPFLQVRFDQLDLRSDHVQVR